MKKSQHYLIFIFLSFSIILSCGELSFASEKPITKIIAFGDSYSDNGEAKLISTKIINSKIKPEEAYIKPDKNIYWNGRYSNGNTAVEILAKKINVPLINYATGGATTGYNNYSEWMDYLNKTGVLGQIIKFEKSLNGKKADPNALYFIFASANDYYYFQDYEISGKIKTVAQTAVNNIKTAVKKLSLLGAKKFFIVNSSDLTLVPYEIMMNRTEEAKVFTKYVNKNLPKSLNHLKRKLPITIVTFDLLKVSNIIIKNPDQYGIVTIDTPCQPTYPSIKKIGKNPDTFYFWDEWHYTSIVHQIIGKKMYQQIKHTTDFLNK